MYAFLTRHRMIAGYSLAFVAMIIGILYVFITPDELARATGVLALSIRYAHSICWFLLAGAAIVFATNSSGVFLRVLSYSALSFYILFIVSILIVDYS